MAKKKTGTALNLISAADAAKIFKVSVETIRKWAAAGKIAGMKASNGQWLIEKNQIAVKPQTTKVIFVIDRSGSMQGLEKNMERAIGSQLSEFKGASSDKFAYDVGFFTFEGTVDRFVDFRPAASAVVPNIYASGATALIDATIAAVKVAQTEMDDDAELATLVVLVTDGEENSSRADFSDSKRAIVDAGKTGRFTVVANCPPNHEQYFMNLGIPPGNIRPWAASAEGIAQMTTASVGAARTYTALRATGQTMSTSFYAQPVTADPAKFAQQLKSSMDDVTGQVAVERVTGKDPVVIKDFCEKKFGAFEKGRYYYQLTESEKVQDYKGIVVKDNATGKFFSGWETARKLLGLPQNQVGTIKIKPGSLGEFTVFVQSTSYNRKLDPGTAVVKL